MAAGSDFGQLDLRAAANFRDAAARDKAEEDVSIVLTTFSETAAAKRAEPDSLSWRLRVTSSRRATISR